MVRISFAVSMCTLLVFGGMLPLAFADSDKRVNWMLGHVDFVEDVDYVRLYAGFAPSAPGPVITGLITSSGTFAVGELPDGTLRLGALGQSWELFPNDGGAAIVSVNATGPFQRGDALWFVAFLADQPARGFGFAMNLPGGEYATFPPDETGFGARSVRVTESSTAGGGAAVSLPRAVESAFGAGALLESRVEPEGIVGALSKFRCFVGPCLQAWKSPDGRTSAGAAVGNVGWVEESVDTTGESFAGPPGEWAWAFAGVTHGEAVAAYVPLGERWPMFLE